MNPAALLTLEEARALLSAVADNPLDRVIVRLGLEAGLRVSEITALELRDVYPDRCLLHVRDSKRGKSRAVRVTEELIDALCEWTEELRPVSESRCLLVSMRTRRGLTSRAVQIRFKRMLERAGFAPERIADLTPHSMRHTYASRCLERGKPLHWVRDQLGHSNIATTNVYLSVADVDGNGAVSLY